MIKNGDRPTAIFYDTYFGATPMRLNSFFTSRGGERVTCYRWEPSIPTGCITTGMGTAFRSIAAGVAAARRHARFVNVIAPEEAVRVPNKADVTAYIAWVGKQDRDAGIE